MSAGLGTRRDVEEVRTPHSPWRGVARGAVVAVVALYVVAAVALTDLEAAALSIVLFLVLAVRRRLPRVSTVVLAVLLGNTALWTLPGVVRNLTIDAPVPAVLLQAAMGASALLALVGLVAQRRVAPSVPARSRGSRGSRESWRSWASWDLWDLWDLWGPRSAVTATVAVVSIAGVLAAAGPGPVTAGSGDLQVVASGTRFVPSQLSAPTGRVTVHLSNEDFFWHTFSIPELDVRLLVPVEGADRVTFDAPAGTWTYICEVPGHSTVMRGELIVSP